MRAAAVASFLPLLLLASCPARVPPLPDSADGAILARSPCPVLETEAAFSAALDAYYKADIEKAGLAKELVARPLTTIFTMDENRRLVDAAKTARCERVSYRSSGLRVTGFVVRPPPSPSRKTPPVLLWARGGNRDVGMIEPVTLLNLLWLADAGFLVVGTQYRGADGGEGADEFGGGDVADLLALVPLAREAGGDTERLYVLGGSRGAMQAALAMKRGLPVRAAAFRAGMTDAHASLAHRPELATAWAMMIPGFTDERRSAALDERSAVQWAGKLRAPILLLHGRQDWRVRVEDTEAFAAALKSSGVEHQVIVYETDEHQLAFHRPEWLAEVVAWFAKHGAYGQRDRDR